MIIAIYQARLQLYETNIIVVRCFESYSRTEIDKNMLLPSAVAAIGHVIDGRI